MGGEIIGVGVENLENGGEEETGSRGGHICDLDEGAEEDQPGGAALDLEGSRSVVCRGCRGRGGGAA